jgi:glucose uptake protein GlcU
MTDAPTVQLTFAVNDPELDDEERQEIAQKLLRQLKQLDEVEKVGRAQDSNLEEGSRSVLATLVGVLTAEVSIDNVKKVLGFVGDRLSDKPIIIKVKVGEQEVEIEAKSRKELEEAEKVANNLLARMQGTSNA